jgi:sortase (surface protein transpeptidase)
MAKLAAAIAAAVIGMTLGVGVVVVLGEDRLPPQTSVPVSLETSPPSEPARSEPPTAAPTAEDRVAKPVRVVIPTIDVDADLVGLGLNDDQSMEVPNFGLAGWYEPGPRPGEAGPAVIAAHVDSVDGPDVFFRLKDLARGDKISVELADGSTQEFVVSRSEQQLKQQLPVDRIWNDTDEVVLRLVTCGGEFDPDERSYKSNVIVYAASA